MDANYLIFVAMLILGITAVGLWAAWYDNKHSITE